ncbi:MAG TPA: B12-binding domain-containing radical SAM protein [Synergistales bacterium]|nr:B12-binding domain-containing radical SAM protein [Synergistales bacterium]
MSDLSGLLSSLKGCRVLGVNPPVMDFSFFDLWAKPLGLLFLLGLLRERGNEVYLIDCIRDSAASDKKYGRRVPARREIPKPEAYRQIPRRFWHYGLDVEGLASRVRSLPRPDLILVTSVMTYWYKGVFWCIEQLKDLLPGVPVILGGIYPVLCPEHASLSGADEIQTVPLPLPSATPTMDLYGRLTFGVALSSTGCPRRCTYCASSLLWPEFRRRDLGRLVAEVDLQVDLGAEDLAFYDDALLAAKEDHFYPLCKGIIDRHPGLRLHAPNGLHVREIDCDCASMLYRAGFKTIRLSLEGVDEVNLKAGGFKASSGEYRAAVSYLSDAGYGPDQVETYVLVGLPGQKASDAVGTIRFVQSLGAKAKIAQYSPIPGTPLFREVLRKHPEVHDEPLLQNNTIYSPFVSGEITAEELQHLKDLANSPG